jgi:hypothetical protein
VGTVSRLFKESLVHAEQHLMRISDPKGCKPVQTYLKLSPGPRLGLGDGFLTDSLSPSSVCSVILSSMENI